MKHPNKHHARDKRCEENMAVLNKWKQTQPSVVFDWKSGIHLRIKLDGQWTDFWPTTGKWYNPYKFKRGSDARTLVEFLSGIKATPPAPKTASEKPTILERLATIDYHINAIRSELREKEPKKTVEPTQSYMLDVLDEKPYDDSWAKGDPFEKDEPPWKD